LDAKWTCCSSGLPAPSKDGPIPAWELNENGVLLTFGIVVGLQFRPDSHRRDAYYRIRLMVKIFRSIEVFHTQHILIQITSPPFESFLDGEEQKSTLSRRTSKQFARDNFAQVQPN